MDKALTGAERLITQTLANYFFPTTNINSNNNGSTAIDAPSTTTATDTATTTTPLFKPHNNSSNQKGAESVQPTFHICRLLNESKCDISLSFTNINNLPWYISPTTTTTDSIADTTTMHTAVVSELLIVAYNPLLRVANRLISLPVHTSILPLLNTDLNIYILSANTTAIPQSRRHTTATTSTTPHTTTADNRRLSSQLVVYIYSEIAPPVSFTDTNSLDTEVGMLYFQAEGIPPLSTRQYIVQITPTTTSTSSSSSGSGDGSSSDARAGTQTGGKGVGSRRLPETNTPTSHEDIHSVVLTSSKPIPARLLKERHISLIDDKKKGHNYDHSTHDSTTTTSDYKDISVSNGETTLMFNNHTGLLERATRCIPHPHSSSSPSYISNNDVYGKSSSDSDVKAQCITTRMVQDYGYYIGYTGYSSSKHHSSEHCKADLRDPHAQNAKPSVSCAHESAEESTQASGVCVRISVYMYTYCVSVCSNYMCIYSGVCVIIYIHSL